MSRIFQAYIADGFVDDCEELLHRCSQFDPLTFEKFTNIWMKMNMGSIYNERTVGAEVAELSEEVIHIAKRYMVANTSKFEESVAGLYLVYCLLTLQPFKGFASLRLVPDDMPAISRIELVARRDRRIDVLYILGEVLIRGPVQFHAENREYGFEHSQRKYLEGTMGIDKYGNRPKGVFYRQNEELDIIKELQNTTKLYEKAKAKITDEYGRQEPNLRYADKEMPSQLGCSLRRIINGLIEDDVKPGSSIADRSDRIRDIKQRAMATAIEPIKHRTAVTDKIKTKPTCTITSPSKKYDIVSKPGKVKSGSPMKPVTTGSPQKGKRARLFSKSKPKRRRKRVPSKESSSSEELSDFLDNDDVDNDDDDDAMNTADFQRVELEVEKINYLNGEPNIETLVEKEYDIHIDTVPIVIKGNVDGDTSHKFEIEFIDHYNPKQTNNISDNSDAENIKEAKKKMKTLSDVTITKVGTAGTSKDAEAQKAKPSTENQNVQLASISKVDEKYNLRKPEKRDLKKPILKSKFKKLGLEPLANFEESKKLKKT